MVTRKMFLGLALAAGFLCVGRMQLSASDCTGVFSDCSNDCSEVIDNLEEVLFDDEIDPSGDYKGLNKYEFVASKLGIIGDSKTNNLSLLLSKVLKSLSLPAMVGAYFGTIVMGKEMYDWEAPAQLINGMIIATITHFLLTELSEYFDRISHQKLAWFNDFVANWPSYKTGTPEEFFQLFDGLHMQYLNSGSRLDVSEDFIHEVVKKVAAGYVEFFASSQH